MQRRTVSCPKCKARRGKPCMTCEGRRVGRTVSYTHAARFDKWVRTQPSSGPRVQSRGAGG